jgi:hypothetical protein
MRCLIVIVLAVLVGGCMKRLMPPEEFQITEVVIDVPAGMQGGSPNFPEAMRVNVLNEAYRLSETGREKRLEVTVTSIRLYDPMRTILVSGTTYVTGTGKVYDIETGNLDTTFEAQGMLANQGGLLAALILPMLADPFDEEQKLARLFAIDAMNRLYGSSRAQQSAFREPSKEAVADYPVSYDVLRQEQDCAVAQMRRERPTNNRTDEAYEEPEPLPAYCAQYGYDVEN